MYRVTTVGQDAPQTSMAREGDPRHTLTTCVSQMESVEKPEWSQELTTEVPRIIHQSSSMQPMTLDNAALRPSGDDQEKMRYCGHIRTTCTSGHHFQGRRDGDAGCCDAGAALHHRDTARTGDAASQKGAGIQDRFQEERERARKNLAHASQQKRNNSAQYKLGIMKLFAKQKGRAMDTLGINGKEGQRQHAVEASYQRSKRDEVS